MSYASAHPPASLRGIVTGPAGATVVQGLVDQPSGSREWAAVDGEDDVWSFGTHRPGAAGIVGA